jgi:hypothetical protein
VRKQVFAYCGYFSGLDGEGDYADSAVELDNKTSKKLMMSAAILQQKNHLDRMKNHNCLITSAHFFASVMLYVKLSAVLRSVCCAGWGAVPRKKQINP